MPQNIFVILLHLLVAALEFYSLFHMKLMDEIQLFLFMNV